MDLSEFAGTYFVKEGSSHLFLPSSPYQLQLYDQVTLTAVGGTQASLRITRAGRREPIFPEQPAVPSTFELKGEHLAYDAPFESVRRRMQISLFRDGPFKAIYGITILGDPEQVGAWGADNNGGP